jgi:hypothetical protein
MDAGDSFPVGFPCGMLVARRHGFRPGRSSFEGIVVGRLGFNRLAANSAPDRDGLRRPDHRDNPGTDNLVIKAATLDPKGWVLHLEAEGKDKSGQAIKFVLDGKIDGIALYNRSISGTWSSKTGKGDFKVTRSKGN